jgi:uncharacterized protein (TIGR02145 family)
LKEVGIIHWGANLGATNSSGFSGLPGGALYAGNTAIGFDNLNKYGFWWCAPVLSSTYPFARSLGDSTSAVHRFGYPLKSNGLSVRCVKD